MCSPKGVGDGIKKPPLLRDGLLAIKMKPCTRARCFRWMNKYFISGWTVVVASLLVSCGQDEELVAGPEVNWETATPASQNIDDLSGLEQEASNLARLTSVAIVRNGKLVHHSYYRGHRADSLHDVRSVTKSVVGLLVGKAVEEGLFQSIDDPVEDYLPASITLNDDQKQITIRHLLNMSGGFEWNETNGNAYNEWALSGEPIQFLLNKPIVNDPGSTYNYNSAAVHFLGVALATATGVNIKDYAQSVLFDKIDVSEVLWERADEDYFNAGSGIRLRTLDMARVGQLILDGGVYGNEQIVRKEWIDFLLTPSYSWRENYGVFTNYTYGSLWWIHDRPEEDRYLAWGYGGQFTYVSQAKALVVVTTTDWRGLSAVGGPQAIEQEAFDLILNYILPKVK